MNGKQVVTQRLIKDWTVGLKQYAVMKTEQNYTKLPANIAIQSAGMDSLKKEKKKKFKLSI